MRMTGVGGEQTRAGEDHAIEPFRMSFVVFKAKEGQSTNVDALAGAIGHQNGQLAVEATGLLAVEAEAVLVVFAGGVADEGVAAVGPPEGGAVVGIERQNLLG